MAPRQQTRRRTVEEFRMARADHDKEVEDLITRCEELERLREADLEQHKQALDEIDRLYSEQNAKMRAELARKDGELESLRRHLAMVINDHRICAHFASISEGGLDHVEQQAAALLDTIKRIHSAAIEAAREAHEQQALERQEQASLPAPDPFGAPGTPATPPADHLPKAPQFLLKNGNGDADESTDKQEKDQ